MPNKKKILYKIYTNDGTLKKVLPVIKPMEEPDTPFHVTNVPSISSEINQGQGQLNLNIRSIFDDFGEGVTVKNNYIIKMWVYDTVNHVDGILMYSGVLPTYEPYFNLNTEGLDLLPYGRSNELVQDFFMSGSSFAFNKNDKASEIFKDIIDHFQTIYTNSDIAYTGGSVEDSAVTVDKDFSDVKWYDAIKQIHELAPAGWWWRIDPDGTANFKAKPSTATHTINLNKHVNKFRASKSMVPVYNRLILRWGSTPTETIYTNSASITAYGRRAKIVTDSSILDSTSANEYGNAFIANNKDEKIRATLTLNSLYDIESVRPGDTVKFNGERPGSELLSDNMQIVKTQYNLDTIDLVLEEDYQNVVKQVRNTLQ